MQFMALTLPEASFIYVGLALQALIRASSVRHIPAAFILVWTAVLIYRAAGESWQAYKPAAGFLGTSLLFVCLFWPEIVPFGAGPALDSIVQPSQVASYAATQDPQADIRTAEDTGLVPQSLRDPLALSPGFRLLLPWLMDVPLAFARAINDQTHRTFPTFLSLQWLLGVDLPADVTLALQDWAQACYVPTLAQVQQQGQLLQGIEDFLPWGRSPIVTALATRSVIPGGQTGYVMRSVVGPGEIPCDAYLNQVLDATQQELFTLTSPAGTPFAVVFQEDLGLEPVEQAMFLTYRTLLPAISSMIPAPSLTAAYLGLRGAAVAGKAVDVGTFTGVVGWMGGAFSWVKTLFGAARGAMQGVFSEWQRVIDGLSGLVGAAVLLLWLAPYILGLAQLMLLALFPLFFFWALIPGRQFQPLMLYFLTFLFTMFSPFWWALIDVCQRLASAQMAPAGSETGALFGLGNAATSFAMGAIVTILGLAVVTIVTSWLLLGTLRSVGGILRAAV